MTELDEEGVYTLETRGLSLRSGAHCGVHAHLHQEADGSEKEAEESAPEG